MTQTLPIHQLPEEKQQEALKLFHALADAQRGRPEAMATNMTANPTLWNATGAYTYLCEHIGDLTHRMAERYCDRMDYGFGPISEKVRKALRYYDNGYGLVREIEGNLKGNFKYRKETDKNFARSGVDWDSFVEGYRKGGQRYAAEHDKLTVWNEAQWTAKQAAVSLGKQQFHLLEKYLRTLAHHLQKGREAWSEWASQVTIDDAGQFIPFRHP